jgi:hypothetical protein
MQAPGRFSPAAGSGQERFRPEPFIQLLKMKAIVHDAYKIGKCMAAA